MKTGKLFFAILLLLLSNAKSFGQVKATTTDGKKVTFDNDKKNWAFNIVDDNTGKLKGQKTYKMSDIKSITTSKGEVTLADLKTKYFSTPQDKEIGTIVITIYGAATCNCIACAASMPNCPNGSDCSHRINIPCGLCCP